MSGILAVPIHGAEDEILELPKDDLPDDPNEIMQILANELAPLKLWLELAVSYYQQQRMEQFQTVMETSTGEDGPFYQDYYQGDKEGRIALLNCLAAYHTQVSVRTKNKSKKEQHLQAANVHYQNSDKIDSNMPLTWCGKALIHMARISIPDKWSRGARDKEMQHLRDAGFMFDQALECDKAFIPALLGKAAVLFNRRHYTNALECYKTVVKLNPACPPEVRLGIAHCYSGLKQYKRAREAFQRVLDLAPDNTEALAGMAVIEMNTTPSDSLTKEEQEQLRAQSVSSGLKLMERAYNSSLQGKRSSVVLNHLANHFIVRGDYQKAHLLAVEAFQNTEVKQIRAEACFHIARTFHMRGKMDEVCAPPPSSQSAPLPLLPTALPFLSLASCRFALPLHPR
jgi:RNA polymerase-associated protein CTR9